MQLQVCFALIAAIPLIACGEDPIPLTAQWRLSPYLIGSTDHIRDLINGPLESVLNRKADKLQQISDCQAKIDSRAAELTKSSPTYIALKNSLISDRTSVAAAKEQDDAVRLINSQNRIESDRIQLQKLVELTAANDPQLAPQRARIATLTAELKDLEPAVTSAAKAREQLMGGLRTGLRLMGPPTQGREGILDKIRPTKIVDSHSFTCDFDSYEFTGEAKDAKVADGFKAYSAVSHRIHLLITQYDTARLNVGSAIQLDQTFKITGTRVVGKQTCVVVEPDESDPRHKNFDGLLKILDTLRVPCSPALMLPQYALKKRSDCISPIPPTSP